MTGRTEGPEVERRLFTELVWCVRNVMHLGRFPFQAALAQAARSTQHFPPHVTPCWVLVGVLVALLVLLVFGPYLCNSLGQRHWATLVENPAAQRCSWTVGSTAGPNSLLELVQTPLLEQYRQLIVRWLNPRLLQLPQRFRAFHP